MGYEHATGLGLVELLTQYGADPALELLVVLALLGPVLPLIAEQGGLVEVAGDVVDGEPLDDART